MKKNMYILVGLEREIYVRYDNFVFSHYHFCFPYCFVDILEVRTYITKFKIYRDTSLIR